MKYTISLAQIDTRLGNLEANLEKHLQWIEQAFSQGSDLLIFPELSLTGYALQDLAPSLALQASPTDPVFARLLEASRSLDLVFGFVEEDARSRFYISSAYCSRGELLHVHRKVYLPTYGMFDEGRFFARGDAVRAFDTRLGRAGMLICEDFWHITPAYLLWMDGADFLVLTSALPGHGLGEGDRFKSTAWTEHILRSYAGLFTTYIFFTNRFGFEDGVYFPGGSAVINPAGAVVSRVQEHTEALVTAVIDPAVIQRTRLRSPLIRDERLDLLRKELARISKIQESQDESN